MADALDVDQLTDELYAAVPDEFVAARTATVKALRAAGQRDEAAAFAKLAKPVQSAWAVNLLARHRPELIDAVVSASDDLRAAHTGGGGAAAIRDAFAARQDAVRAAVEAAGELAGGRLSDQQRVDVAATLEAAAADPDAAESVRTGRLTQPLAAPSGFELLGDVAPPPRRARATAGKPTKATKAKKATKAAAATTVDRPRDDQDRARRAAADEAAAAAESARSAWEEAQQRVVELEDQRDRLSEQFDELAVRLSDARREARELRRAAEQAQRRAAKAAEKSL